MSFHSQHLPDTASDLDLFTGWQVVSFVDPAGTGGDLAFTEGLSTIDLPELLLWARPTEGLDPGADWLLTHRERSRLLNRWAVELITDNLRPGTQREERFDGGRSAARFRFGRPSQVSPLQHPYLPAKAKVVCVAWSLLRQAPDARSAGTLSAAAARRMERWIAAADATVLDRRLRPGLLAQATAAVLPDQNARRLSPGDDRFGPLSRWVEARIRQVLSSDADVVAGFLDRLQAAEHARCEDCLLEDLTRLATRADRNGAAREASRVAPELGLAVTGPPGQPTASWLRTAAMTTESSLFTEAGLRTALADGLEVLLVAAALADVAPPALTASATGPWEWALSDHRAPGRLWLARPAVRRAARDLLAPATPALVQAAVEQALQSAGPEQRALGRLVMGLQTTAAASAQPGVLLRRQQSNGLPRSVAGVAERLAGQLLTAMALPHRFPGDSWELLRQTVQPLAPRLPLQLPVEVS